MATKVDYVNPNLFQADGDISEIDVRSIKSLSIRCPHCGSIGTFRPSTQGLVYPKTLKSGESFGTSSLYSISRICPDQECRGIVVTISSGDSAISVVPPELLDFDSKNLPENLLLTLKEAIACHSVGAYRAAAMMVRRLLEEVCDENQAEGTIFIQG